MAAPLEYVAPPTYNQGPSLGSIVSRGLGNISEVARQGVERKRQADTETMKMMELERSIKEGKVQLKQIYQQAMNDPIAMKYADLIHPPTNSDLKNPQGYMEEISSTMMKIRKYDAAKNRIAKEGLPIDPNTIYPDTVSKLTDYESSINLHIKDAQERKAKGDVGNVVSGMKEGFTQQRPSGMAPVGGIATQGMGPSGKQVNTEIVQPLPEGFTGMSGAPGQMREGVQEVSPSEWGARTEGERLQGQGIEPTTVDYFGKAQEQIGSGMLAPTTPTGIIDEGAKSFKKPISDYEVGRLNIEEKKVNEKSSYDNTKDVLANEREISKIQNEIHKAEDRAKTIYIKKEKAKTMGDETQARLYEEQAREAAVHAKAAKTHANELFKIRDRLQGGFTPPYKINYSVGGDSGSIGSGNMNTSEQLKIADLKERLKNPNLDPTLRMKITAALRERGAL